MSTLINRKLLPLLLSPCLHLCDPSCTNFPEDCYSLHDPIFNPPDPSPLPPPNHQGSHLPTVVKSIIILLVIILLAVSYFAIFVKWNRLTTRQGPTPPNPGHSGNDDDSQAPDWDDPDSFLLNPIWLISTVGLQQSVINAIRKIKYKKDEGVIEGRDCSVCLSEFEEGETLRILPKCNHAFHIDCIDPWLRSHTNCPLCRAGVVLSPGQDGPALGSDDPSFGHSRRTELARMDDIELGSSSLAGDSETEHCEYDTENGRNKRGVGRSLSMNFCLGRDYRNVGDPGLQRNAKWSSFRIMGSSTSSSRQVKRSYSCGENISGSGRYQKRSSYPQSSS